jgi:hypothetical protein
VAREQAAQVALERFLRRRAKGVDVGVEGEADLNDGGDDLNDGFAFAERQEGWK